MKEIILFLAVSVVCCAAKRDSGLRVKWDIGLSVGKKFFYDMPRTIQEATALNWTMMERPTSPLPTLDMYCPVELKFCVLFDPVTKYIAGFQVSLPENELSKVNFNVNTQGFINWTVTNGTETIKYLTKQGYFISEETLSKTKAERLEAIENGTTLQEDAIWLTGFNQKLMKVPTNPTGIVNAGFTKQRCIPWMGTHYFYNMTTSLNCLADTVSNWFLLVDSDELIGAGFMMFGVMPAKTGERDFFERPSSTNLKVIVKDAPDCLINLADDPTGFTMHIYFIDKPTGVGCSLF